MFVDRRAYLYNELCNNDRYRNLNISTKLGAEVLYSEKLTEIDVDLICFQNSKYILIDFPIEILPFGITKSQITKTMYYLLSMGYVPVVAHIERYIL